MELINQLVWLLCSDILPDVHTFGDRLSHSCQSHQANVEIKLCTASRLNPFFSRILHQTVTGAVQSECH